MPLFTRPRVMKPRLTFKVAAAIRCAVIALVLAAKQGDAQTIISTPGGAAPIGPFGEPDAQTFGQTFLAPSDNILQSFTFFLSPAPSLTFRAYVFSWDQLLGRATGPALYTSATIIGPGPIGIGFTPITVNPGVFLDPGLAYVAFFSSSGLGSIGEIALQSDWDSPAANLYASGAFVYLNNGENPAAWTTQTWSTNRQGVGSDVRFTMVFTATPEPSSFVLAATALIALGGAAYRRRRTESRGGSRPSE